MKAAPKKVWKTTNRSEKHEKPRVLAGKIQIGVEVKLKAAAELRRLTQTSL